MATYPNTQLNLGQSSPEDRNDLYSGEGLYIFDREQTSFLVLFELAKNFVQNKNDSSTFRDFFAGSVGSTLIELASGYSEFNSYASIVSRRESYLPEARLIDSAIGMAQTLGYSTFRGQNPKFTLTFIPTVDMVINKFDIIGSVNSYDVISLEDKSLKYGESTDLLVVIGTLKIAALSISDAKTYDFRFAQDKISEDIQLKLDGTIVPISNILYDLLEDNFVVLSNPVGGIDVRYLNRSQPERWIEYNRYTFLDYVLPRYDWRSKFSYSVGDIVSRTDPVDFLPILYVCVNEGVSSLKEPNWNEITGEYTSDSFVRWKCLGRIEKQYFFRNITPGISISGLVEPIWLHATQNLDGSWKINPLGQKVVDGNLEWICTETYEYSKYFYNTGSILQLTYVELEDIAYTKTSLQLDIGTITNVSIENEFKDAENLKEIKRNAPLYNETRYVIRGREDYRKIFQILLTNCVDTNGFDPIPAVVELTYVKDHTNHLWTPDTYYEVGDEVISTDGNGRIYRATSSGYGGTTKKGTSGNSVPNFYSVIEAYSELENQGVNFDTVEMQGEIISALNPVKDNVLTWYPRFLGSKTRPPMYWQPSNEYNLHDEIDIGHQKIYFTLEEINAEPDWPLMFGESVKDNTVNWVCVDHIYLDGYDFEYWKQDHYYKLGTYVMPVVETGYFYLCMKEGKSGPKEPNWPITICDEIQDGGEDGCTWQCFDRSDAPKYVKNNCVKKLEKYRQYGVSPPIITDPRLVIVDIKFELVNNINIDRVTIQKDLFNIIDKYQRKLNTYVDIKILEESIEEQMDYVKIARAKITGNNKTQEHQEGHLYRISDVVSVVGSPYLYVANRIETGGYGYTQWRDRSYSQTKEPDWNDPLTINEGNTYKDGKLVWEIKNRNIMVGELNSYWEPDTVYPIGAVVLPTGVTSSTYYAEVIEVEYPEINWPKKPGTSILDGRVFWTCIDPEKTAVPLGWDEYYLFNFSFTYERFYKK